MFEWTTIEDEAPLFGWEAWTVSVKVGRMPDGTIAPIGLRIEPRDDYDGSLKDQRITLEKLRRFPIGVATAAAKQAIFGPTIHSDLDYQVEVLREAVDRHNEFSADLKVEMKERDDAEYQARIEEVGPKIARLERIAWFYRVFQARPLPDDGGVRQALSKSFGVSTTTVDRLLRDARDLGILERYDGKQGKHGKTPTKKPRGKK